MKALPMLTATLVLIAPCHLKINGQEAARPQVGFRAAVETVSTTVSSIIMRSSPKTHWEKGAIIGAVAGILFANALMDDEGSGARRLGLSVVGGAVFMMPGALLGGLFPKR